MRVGLFKSASSAGRGSMSPSSIRGKISGPIPIPNPAEDDEFPIRRPGTGLATPLGVDGKSQLHMPLEGPSTLEAPSSTGRSSDVAPEERTESVVQAGPSQASDTSGSPAQRRTNRSSTLRYSVLSAGTDTDQSRAAPQRKKSTLRSALSKLFGRRRKDATHDSTLETHLEGGPRSSAQHRSDPSALSRVVTREGEPKRSASLPITEFDRALRSHSVGPDDMIAIESARNSMHGEPIKNRRRAATTSSRLYTERGRDFDNLAGLSPRPASASGRDGEYNNLEEEDPENIGRAITSDLFTSRRRSRSLSQLQDPGEGQNQRKRSDEIRYWRESYDPGFQSPTSSNPNDDTGNFTIDRPETPVETKPKTPPQPFNFGTMVGMKITQAASLEERIATLESRNQKLEKLVAQLFQVVPGINDYPYTPERNPPPVPRAPSTSYTSASTAANPTLYQTVTNETQPSSRYSGSRKSNDSFGDGHTFIGSIPPSTRPIHRPTSNATVRGTTSLPTLPREGADPFTADHYTTLLALVETERSARQMLEAQVRKLNNRLNLIARMNKKPEPTDSPHSAFEHDDDLDEPHAIGGDDDYSGSEAFKTPREEHPQHGFGAFGEELKEEEGDGSRKKAARTLSLSQLTLGKPAPAHPPQPEVGVRL